MVMKGLTWSSLKKTPSLLPLFFFVGIGVTAAIGYTLRVAIKNPEISINRKGNPEPWNDYRNKQYKFYSPTLKSDEHKSVAPEY